MLERASRRPETPVLPVRAAPVPLQAPSNHLLARQGDPQPGEAGHQQAFDTFVSGLFASSDPAHLQEVRAACDAASTPANATLDYNGNRLVVDQRNRTAVMTRIRWRAMDRIHELSEQHGATERTAADEAARIAARKLLLDESKPYLDFLKGEIKDPQSKQDKFQHWYDAVQRSVLRVLELLAVEDAQGVGLKPDGTGKTRDELKGVTKISEMGSEPWCGAFASVAMAEAGVSPSAVSRVQLDGEAGILSFMAYEDQISASKKIKVGGETMSVRAFHASRNSLRKTQVIENADRSPGFALPKHAEVVSRNAVQVNPGDILLLDNRGGNRPDHVMIATSSDISHMTKIAGNETSTPGGQVASGGDFDITAQPDAISAADQRMYDQRVDLKNRKKAGTATPQQEKALEELEAKIKAFELAHPKQPRIAAVCRFSIVDFEVHDYV